MARTWLLTLASGAVLLAQDAPQQQPPPAPGPPLKTRDDKSGKSGSNDSNTVKPADGVYQTPPEEDDEEKPRKEYAFNPVQAKREMHIGEFYYKKGNYRAALNRFTEASKWNPGFAEAYVRMGEAAEKLNDRVAEKDAYTKYLDANPDAKNAGEIKKKLSALK